MFCGICNPAAYRSDGRMQFAVDMSINGENEKVQEGLSAKERKKV